jgi:hypothetical protein
MTPTFIYDKMLSLAKHFTYLIILIFLSIPFESNAAQQGYYTGTTSEGREFWVSFSVTGTIYFLDTFAIAYRVTRPDNSFRDSALSKYYVGKNIYDAIYVGMHPSVPDSFSYFSQLIENGDTTDTLQFYGKVSDSVLNAQFYFSNYTGNGDIAESSDTLICTAQYYPVPPSPQLESPISGVIEQPDTLSLTWKKIPDGIPTYHIQVAYDTLFTQMVHQDSTLTTTTLLIQNLAKSTKFFWRVAAFNKNGKSHWSEVRTFTTQMAIPPPPNPLAPASGTTINNDTVTLLWSSTPGASMYRIQLSSSPQFTSIAIYDSSYTTAYFATFIELGITYYWRIQSVNSSGTSSWSTNIRSLLTLPKAPTLISPINGNITRNLLPTLHWTDDTTVKTFEIQITIDGDFHTSSPKSYLTRNNYLPAPEIRETALYYWRVRTNNNNGEGYWSPTQTFSTEFKGPPTIPILLSPDNNSVEIPSELAISWDSTYNTAIYKIQLAKDTNFSVIYIEDTTAQQSFHFTSLPANSNFFWRVWAINSLDSVHSDTRKFSTVKTSPPQPDLSAPADNSINRPISFDVYWKQAPVAQSYTIEIALEHTFSTPIFSQSAITDTSFTLTNLLYDTTYYWRIKASNEIGDGSWSAAWQFSTISLYPSIPSIVSPVYNETNIPITATVKWKKSSGAELYIINLSTDSSFLSLTHSDSIQSDTAFQFANLIENTTYHIRVRSKNQYGTSRWSQRIAFTTINTLVTAPSLLLPESNAMHIPCTTSFTWNKIPDATRYHIQVTTSSDFSSLIFEDSTLTDSAVINSSLQNNITYYWRIRAKRDVFYSNWSAPRQFTTVPLPAIAPALIYPENNAINVSLNVTLHWNKSHPADYYYVQVFSQGEASSLIVNDSMVNDTTYSLVNISSGTTFLWRIKAKNSLGTSTWSQVNNFTTFDYLPAIPELTLPENNIANVSPFSKLVWNPVTAAQSYRLQISYSNDFTVLLLDDSSLTQPSAPLPNLANGSQVFWRVLSKNEFGCSKWSQSSDFTLLSVPSKPILLSPNVSSKTSGDSIIFLWRKSVYNSNKYTLQIGSDSLFSTIVVIDSTNGDTTITVRKSLSGTFWWKISASNDAGVSEFSSPLKIIITNAGIHTLPSSTGVNYWNISKHSLMIQYGLSHSTIRSVSIFNLNGKVFFSDTRHEAPGVYTFSINASRIPSGHYIIRFKTDKYNIVKNCIIAK